MKKQDPKDRVADDEWISQEDAAARLGVGLAKLALLLANDHLIAAGNSRDDMGVTRASLDDELHWRAAAGPWARVRRRLVDLARWF